MLSVCTVIPHKYTHSTCMYHAYVHIHTHTTWSTSHEQEHCSYKSNSLLVFHHHPSNPFLLVLFLFLSLLLSFLCHFKISFLSTLILLHLAGSHAFRLFSFHPLNPFLYCHFCGRCVCVCVCVKGPFLFIVNQQTI